MFEHHTTSKVLQRRVLSSPSSIEQVQIQTKVILIVSILSIVGAGWIVLSFCVSSISRKVHCNLTNPMPQLFRQARSFRHQLILGLAISDLLMAVNFLSSCAVNLNGHLISEPPQKAFCSFNGFMTQLFVVQSAYETLASLNSSDLLSADYWVLVIAFCTFFFLANYRHLSTWVQDHRIILWTLPWILSTLWASLGLGIAGYGDIGACETFPSTRAMRTILTRTGCWFTSDKVRLLVNFIPRWIIIITILVLYARLYHLIYTAHNRFMSFSDETTPRTVELEPETDSVSSTRRIGHPSTNLNVATDVIDNKHPRRSVANPGRTHVRGPSTVLKKMAYQMMMYPLVYMLIWTCPTAIRIYQSVTGRPAPFWIATVDKVDSVSPSLTLVLRLLKTPTGLYSHSRICRRDYLRCQRDFAQRMAPEVFEVATGGC